MQLPFDQWMDENIFNHKSIMKEKLYTRELLAAEKGYDRGQKLGFERGIEHGLEQGIEHGLKQGIERGIEQGIERGIEQGIEQGEIVGQSALLRQLLVRKFGPLPEWACEQLVSPTLNQITRWGDRILEAESLEAVFE